MTRKPHHHDHAKGRQGDTKAQPQQGPNESRRQPAPDDVARTGEDDVDTAVPLDENDPLASMIEDTTDGGQGAYDFELVTGMRHGGPPLEQLSVEPDELGANFLRGAVQDPRPEENDDVDVRRDRENLTQGEARMLNAIPGGAENEGALITELPDLTDVEAELDELSERAGREVRNPDRAERIREQSLRVAKQRRTPVRGHPR